MRPALAVIVRLMAFVGKEIIETLRRPGAILSLILGPFLIMAVFGLGYSGFKRPLETVIVAPPTSGLPADVETYQELAGGGLHISEVTTDRAAAEARLRAGTRRRGHHRPGGSRMRSSAPASSRSSRSSSTWWTRSPRTTRASLPRAWRRPSTARSSSAWRRRARAMPWPRASPRPTRSHRRSSPRRHAPRSATSSPSTPHVISYFAPAVLALILQHLAVTLVAMSLVRERTSGVIELFRIAPVSAAEVLTGKVLAFGLIGGAIATMTVALLVLGLGVPMVGAVATHRPRHRPAAAGVVGPRPPDRGRLGLGATGRPAVASRAARVGVLQRFRPADQRVQ